MAKSQKFQHLPLPFLERGIANIHGGGNQSDETKANKANRVDHSRTISGSVTGAVQARQSRIAERDDGLPEIPDAIALLLEVDPNLQIDDLRKYFDFEIVSEEDKGFVIVASGDTDLSEFLAKVQGFVDKETGTATIASIHRLDGDPEQKDRLERILSESLFSNWSTMDELAKHTVDVGIVCLGTEEIPWQKERGSKTDQKWALEQAEWAAAKSHAYESWDNLKEERELEVKSFVDAYNGNITQIIDGAAFDAAELPDSFTMRIEIEGRGLRDLVLNYAYIFEVVEPDDIELLESTSKSVVDDSPKAELNSPTPDAPTVCVIDSGIQEGHVLLAKAIDSSSSYSYLPGIPSVADEVSPGGHGTRVAGAVLFGETIPKEGDYDLGFWIQNARVIGADNKVPDKVFPPAMLEAIVQRFHFGERKTRIYNQSINAIAPCRLRHMSAWAASIDRLSFDHDVLFVQSIGNVCHSSINPVLPGVRNHLDAGRKYPDYLLEGSCRVANPGQSLQALTVGSISYGLYQDDQWRSFSNRITDPSAFSRTGGGIWGVNKPDVVEFGGDFFVSDSNDVSNPLISNDHYPELVRSTKFGGPIYDSDEVGTSFSTPKVTHIVAALQAILPEEPCLLYRALVVQSARWPGWALDIEEPAEKYKVMRSFGYGLPNIERATTNTSYRSTLITEGQQSISPSQTKIFQIPIPLELRRPGENYDILIEVTLSYVAQPRRTRRQRRKYLSTWLDWKSSNLDEKIVNFRRRALKDTEKSVEGEKGKPIPWTIHDRDDWGTVHGVQRSAGTVQKDWAVVKSNKLPEDFCVAVTAHKGWSNDPDTEAKFALAVSFESIDEELEIHERLQVAIEDLQVEIGEIEVQV